jgi:HSP90 family molecular chaperone
MQPNSPQLRWESSAGSSFTVTPDNSTPFEESGTRVILHVKEEMEEYLDDANLSLLLQKYSEFIQFPIELQRNVSKVLSEPDIDAPVEEDGTIPTKVLSSCFF